MARSNFLQTSFLGGEWSPFMQGRMDRQDYRTALNVCLNVVPVEEGAAPRRSGFRWIAPTRRSQPGVLRPFHFTQDSPYDMEFTAGHLRFFYRAALVLASEGTIVGDISAATPAVITTAAPTDIAEGDEVVFFLSDGSANTDVAFLLNRVFYINDAASGMTFPISDTTDLTDFDGSTVTLGANALKVARVLDIDTTYTEDQLEAIRVVQDSTHALILHHEVKPYVVTSSAPGTNSSQYASFAYAAAVFVDGPYMDPPKDGSTVTPSGLSGSITITASIGGGDEPPAFSGFVATDVGRAMRFLSEPLDYDSATAYTAGDHVKYNGAYWTALKASTNKQPNLDVLNWAIDPSGAIWTWGRITAYTDSTHVTVAIQPLVVDETDNIASGPLLYTHAIKTWRMGLYSDATGWPSCGCYEEGRLWLSGATANRFDAGVSNDFFNFAPTGRDGSVGDQNAIGYTFNSAEVQDILWMEPDDQGILCGTQASEWLIRASTLNDPLTPTSVQAKPVTHYGSFSGKPVRTGLALCFIQRYGRKVLEFVANPQPAKFSGTNLSLSAKHMSAPGIVEVAYQQELAPVLWARRSDGKLIGCSYKRDDPYGTQPVAFAAWHRTTLGDNRFVTSLAAGPSPNGLLDSIMTISQRTVDDVDTNWVELQAPLFDEDTPIAEGFFLDSASPAVAAEIISSPFDGVRLYGYSYLAGQSGITVTAGGLDLGDYTVAANGTIDVPFGADEDGLFTLDFLQTLTDSGSTFDGLGVVVLGSRAAGTPELGGIQEYFNSTSPLTSLDTSTFAPLWDSNVGYAISGGNTSAAGIRRFNLTTGEETGFNQIGGTIGPSGFVIAPIAVSALNEVFWNDNHGDPGVLRKVDGTTLAQTGSVAGHTVPYSLVTSQAGDNTYVWASDLSPGGSVYVFDGTSMGYSGFTFYLDETKGVLAAGPEFTGSGLQGSSVYCLGKHKIDEPSVLPLGLYRFGVDSRSDGWNYIVQGDNPNIDGLKIGEINPHDIDATWTHFTNIRALIYDGTDGNVMFWAEITAPAAWGGGNSYFTNDVVTGSDNHVYASTGSANIGHDPVGDLGVHWTDRGANVYTHSHYLVKASVSDASILWAIPLNGTPNFDRPLQTTKIAFGRLGWLSTVTTGSNNYPYYYIDTVAGTILSTTSVNQVVATLSIFDDLLGQTIIFGQYTSGGAAPLPIGSTVSFTAKYATLLGTPGGIVNYYGPFLAGYTYTSDGQIVRPVSPQEIGSSQGPGLGKLRRDHQVGILFHKAQGVSIGTDFSNLRPAEFCQPDGTAFTRQELFSDVHQATIEDDSTFNSMVCWRVTRPYPCTVCAIEPFMQTQDK